MSTNFRIINNNEELRRKLKKRKTKFNLLTVAFCLCLMIGGLAILLMSKTAPALSAVITFFFWTGSAIIYLIQLESRDNPSLSSFFLSYTENAINASANVAIEHLSSSEKRANINITTENADHTISHHSISFPVIEKTDVTEYVLDLMEEKVYVPYVERESEGQDANNG